MPDLPPRLRLTPDDIARHKAAVANDPEKKLAPQARQRISKAYDDQLLIRHRVMAKIELRWEAESSDVSFSEYLSKGQAWIDFVESNLAAARLVLQTAAEEFWKLGLPKREFRGIMESQIEAAVYSFELRNHQKLVLESEFGSLWAPPDGIATASAQSEASVSASKAPPALSAAERVRAFMKRKSIDIPAFARMIGKSPRTVASVLAGDPVGKDTRTLVARALGTTPEELFD